MRQRAFVCCLQMLLRYLHTPAEALLRANPRVRRPPADRTAARLSQMSSVSLIAAKQICKFRGNKWKRGEKGLQQQHQGHSSTSCVLT